MDPYLSYGRVLVRLSLPQPIAGAGPSSGTPGTPGVTLGAPHATPGADSRFFRTKALRLDLRLRDIFTESSVIVSELGQSTDPNQYLCQYLLNTDNTIYVTHENVVASPMVSQPPPPISPDLRGVTGHGFLFELQQRLKETTGVSCRLTFPPDVRLLVLKLRDIHTVLEIFNRVVYVRVSPPRSLTINLRDGATLSLGNEHFSMEDNKLIASKSLVDSLKEFVSISESPEDKWVSEVKTVASFMRAMLDKMHLAPNLLEVSDDMRFMDLFVSTFVNKPAEPRSVVAIVNSINDAIGDTAIVARNQLVSSVRYVLRTTDTLRRRIVAVLTFMFDNDLASLCAYVIVNMIISSLINPANMFIEVTLLALLLLNILFAVLKHFFAIDTTDWTVQHAFPIVYPQEIAPSEMDKFIQHLCDVDESRRGAEIRATVEALKIYPSWIKVFLASLLSTLPSMVFLWKEKNEGRKALLIRSINIALDKEQERRRALEAQTPRESEDSQRQVPDLDPDEPVIRHREENVDQLVE